MPFTYRSTLTESRIWRLARVTQAEINAVGLAAINANRGRLRELLQEAIRESGSQSQSGAMLEEATVVAVNAGGRDLQIAFGSAALSDRGRPYPYFLDVGFRPGGGSTLVPGTHWSDLAWAKFHVELQRIFRQAITEYLARG